MEWSNWLTPRNYKRRYDTLFFTCYSEQKPEPLPDQQEVTDVKVIQFFFVFLRLLLLRISILLIELPHITYCLHADKILLTGFCFCF